MDFRLAIESSAQLWKLDQYAMGELKASCFVFEPVKPYAPCCHASKAHNSLISNFQF
jgi:hypothetical protein